MKEHQIEGFNWFTREDLESEGWKYGGEYEGWSLFSKGVYRLSFLAKQSYNTSCFIKIFIFEKPFQYSIRFNGHCTNIEDFKNICNHL